jgi:1-acyl-sn-glycerol-3-phosphate acyltransferase
MNAPQHESFLRRDQLYPAEQVWRALWPLRAWFRPTFHGLEQLDGSRPVVFVANHTVLGVYDILTAAGIARFTPLRPRGLHAPIYERVPGWSGVLRGLGGVPARGDSMRALLAAGESPLVCPGGLREVAKRKHEKYRLMWGEHLGWVRNAVAHGAPLVPLATVGPEEAVSIVFDSDDVVRWAARAGLQSWLPRGDLLLPPLAWGIGPTPIPRPVKFRIALGAPIETAAFRQRAGDEDTLRMLRDKVRARLAEQIARLRRGGAGSAPRASGRALEGHPA